MNTKKEYFKISELIGLDGLPKTPQGILKKAKRENWEGFKVKGKVLAYHMKYLPIKAQIALIEMLKNKEIELEREKNKAFIETLKNKEKLENEILNNKNIELNELRLKNNRLEQKIITESRLMLIRARLEIVLNFQMIRKNLFANKYYDFSSKYNNNDILIFKWVKILIPKLSWRDLNKWCDSVSKGDLLALGE